MKVFQRFGEDCLLYLGLSDRFKDIHPEDGRCRVCRNVGKPSEFRAAYLKNQSCTLNASRENRRTNMVWFGLLTAW